MSLVLRSLTILAVFLIVTGCVRTPKPQSGGGNVTTLGGGAPTSVSTTAPENSQTPTTTTVKKRTERTYTPAPQPAPTNTIPHETGGGATASAMSSDRDGFPRREQSETTPAKADGSRVAPVAAPSSPPAVLHEVISEEATTQIGTSQDLAGILKVWGNSAAAHYRSLLWCLVLGVAAWTAWRREWPLIAAILGVGALVSLLVAWWAGPVAAGAAALVWTAYHVAHAKLPKL